MLPMANRDGYAVGTLNADGSTPKPKGATAHAATARRRSRASIVAASKPVADDALRADAAAMLAADRIG